MGEPETSLSRNPVAPPLSGDAGGVAVVVALVVLGLGSVAAGGALYLDDTSCFNLPLRAFTWAQWRAGDLPLWWPSAMGGMPILGEGQAGALYPLNILGAAFSNPVTAYSFVFVATYLIAALGLYALARRLGLSPPASAVAAAVFTLGGPMVSHHPHIMMVEVVALWPWTILAALAACEGRRRIAWGALAAALVALQWLAFSPQALVIGAVIVGWLGAWRGYREGRGAGVARGLGLVAVIYAIGTAAAAVQLWPVAEYWASLGGGPGARTFDRPPWPLKFVVLGPVLSELFGWWRNKIWGFHWSETCLFSGVAAVALAVGGLAARRARSHPWFLPWLWLLGAALVFGTAYVGAPFQKALAHVPVLQGVRCHTRVAFAAVMALAMLAGIAVDATDDGRARRRMSLGAAAVVVLTLAAMFVLPAAVGRAGGIWALRADFWRSIWAPGGQVFLRTAVAGAAAVLLLLDLRRPVKARRWLLAAVVGLEMVAFSAGSIWTQPAERFQAPAALMAAEAAAGGGGALAAGLGTLGGWVYQADVPKNQTNLWALWDVRLANGRFAEALRPDAPDALCAAALSAGGPAAAQALGRLGVRWVAVPGGEEAAGTRLMLGGCRLTEASATPALAWAPRQVRPADGAGAALEAYRALVAAEASDVVPVEGLAQPKDCAPAQVTIIGESQSRLELDVAAAGPTWVFIAQSWQPGWRASVGGQPAAVHRAAGYYTAVPVAAGRHQVVLRYVPEGILWGAGVSLVVWLALLAALVVESRRRAGKGDGRGQAGGAEGSRTPV